MANPGEKRQDPGLELSFDCCSIAMSSALPGLWRACGRVSEGNRWGLYGFREAPTSSHARLTTNRHDMHQQSLIR
jgi:hypothetical protein